jgi:hypothetical protein
MTTQTLLSQNRLHITSEVNFGAALSTERCRKVCAELVNRQACKRDQADDDNAEAKHGPTSEMVNQRLALRGTYAAHSTLFRRLEMNSAFRSSR